MKIKHYISFLIVTLSFAVLFSCSTDETCRKSKTVEAGVTFYLDTINLTTGNRVQLKITIDTLTVNGIGIDSLLYNKVSTGSIKLPLNKFAEESKFRIKMSQVVDTITIRYRNQTEFLSLECGSVRTHSIDTVLTTGYFIDSVAISNPTVNTISVENIQLHHNQ